MQSTEEIHQRLMAFLGEEFAKKTNRACVRLELHFNPTGMRPETLRTWLRETDPEPFENVVKTTELVTTIIQECENHADSYGVTSPPPRYTLRAQEYAGGRRVMSFSMAVSASVGTELATQGGSGVPASGNAAVDLMQILSGNNRDLMRTNTQMFGQAFTTLANMNQQLQERNHKLEGENANLRGKIEELSANSEDREFHRAMQFEKNARASKALDAALQIGSVVGAKIAGLNDELGTSGLHLLVGKFGESLEQEQFMAIAKILKQPQLLMLYEIMEAVKPKKVEAKTG